MHKSPHIHTDTSIECLFALGTIFCQLAVILDAKMLLLDEMYCETSNYYCVHKIDTETKVG